MLENKIQAWCIETCSKLYFSYFDRYAGTHFEPQPDPYPGSPTLYNVDKTSGVFLQNPEGGQVYGPA